MGAYQVTGPYIVTGLRARQMRVIPADVLRRLYGKSDAKGFIQTGAHLALLIAGGWLVLLARDSWWIIPALLVTIGRFYIVESANWLSTQGKIEKAEAAVKKLLVRKPHAHGAKPTLAEIDVVGAHTDAERM